MRRRIKDGYFWIQCWVGEKIKNGLMTILQSTHSINLQRWYTLVNYPSPLFNFSNGYSNNINYSTTFSRNSIFNPIYPRSGSKFSIYLEFTPPYSLFREEFFENVTDNQEKYKFLEYNKFKFDGTWYNSIIGDLVIRTHFELGFLGTYNSSVGLPPFERFFVGGDGLSGYSIDGREIIALERIFKSISKFNFR